MSVIEKLEPLGLEHIEKQSYFKELLKCAEIGKFVLIEGLAGQGIIYTLKGLSHKLNRVCFLLNLDELEDFEDGSLDSVLENLVDAIKQLGEKSIIVIENNKIINNDMNKINNLRLLFEKCVFNKIETTVFYCFYE